MEQTPHQSGQAPEQLLAQSDWVRRLAAKLVHDANWADDLAQETLLTAWSHANGSLLGRLKPRELRLWLARVLRNRLHQEQRAGARRRVREEERSHLEHAVSAAALVERASNHRRVVEAVLRLSEPHRQALLLRYFEDHTHAAIASELNISVEAARKRISQALALLKEELAEDFGPGAHGVGAILLGLSSGRDSAVISLGTKGLSALVNAKVLLTGLAATLLVTLWAVHISAPHSQTASANTHEPVELASLTSTPQASGIATSSEATTNANEARLAVAVTAPAVLEIRVTSSAPNAALAGAKIFTAIEKTSAELLSGIHKDWRALGIEESAETWLAQAREEAMPPEPSTPDSPPYQVKAGDLLGTTDEQGLFRLAALPAAGAGLLIQSKGKLSTIVRRSQLEATAQLEPTANAPKIEVKLRELGSLPVLVEDWFGAPVECAYLRVELDGSETKFSSTLPSFNGLKWHGPTDSAGRLHVDGIPLATTLMVTPLGDFVGVPTQARGAREKSARPLVLRVHSLGGVRGQLVSESGEPLAGALLAVSHLERRGAFRDQTTTTNADGRFHFEKVRAGTSRMIWTALGEPESMFRGNVTSLELDLVEVAAGQISELGSIVIPSLAHVSGSLTRAPMCTPKSSLTFEIYRDRTQVAAGAVQPDGSFRIALPKGEYSMRVVATDWLPTAPMTQQTTEVGTFRVVCPSKDLTLEVGSHLGGLRLNLPPGMPDKTPLRIRLSSLAPAKLKSVTLEGSFLSMPGGDALASASRSRSLVKLFALDGVATLSGIPQGAYDVELAAGDFGTHYFQGVRITPGEFTELGEVDLDGVKLRGHVFDSAGLPAVGAEVTIAAWKLAPYQGVSPTVWRRATTDENGAYALDMVDSRHWTAYATQNLTEVSELAKLAPEPGSLVNLDFHLQPTCKIQGRITRNGKGVPDERILLFFGQLDTPKLTLGAPPSVRTDSEGYYSFEPCFPWSHEVHFSNSSIRAYVELAPGECRTLDLELDREWGELSIDLSDQDAGAIVSVTGQTDEAGTWRRHFQGELRGGNRIRVPKFDGAVALHIGVTHANDTMQTGAIFPSYLIPIPKGALQNGAVFAAPTGIVEVPFDRRLSQVALPKLRVISLPDLDATGAALWTLPHEQLGNMLRFHGVPTGAGLELTSFDGTAPPLVKRFQYTGGGVLRVELE